MAESPVLYDKHDSIVTLTLNRPETLNAMNEAMMAELERLLIAVEADTTVRVVVLTGAGRAFSSGGDQKRERQSEGEQVFFDGDLGGSVIERLNRCVLRLQRLAKPVIGSINGVAVGAGCNIAFHTRQTSLVGQGAPRQTGGAISRAQHTSPPVRHRI